MNTIFLFPALIPEKKMRFSNLCYFTRVMLPKRPQSLSSNEITAQKRHLCTWRTSINRNEHKQKKRARIEYAIKSCFFPTDNVVFLPDPLIKTQHNKIAHKCTRKHIENAPNPFQRKENTFEQIHPSKKKKTRKRHKKIWELYIYRKSTLNRLFLNFRQIFRFPRPTGEKEPSVYADRKGVRKPRDIYGG